MLLIIVFLLISIGVSIGRAKLPGSVQTIATDSVEAQWDTPSLCAGWRVREVVAHMTMAARYPEDKFMAELRRCDFGFGRRSNEIASRDAGLPASELVASLRSDVMQH